LEEDDDVDAEAVREPDEEELELFGAADDAYRKAVFVDTVNTLRDNSARDVLASFGDAVEARIQRCLGEATNLRGHRFFGPAVVSTVTAIELIFRFLLLKPLVRGAFLSNEWDAILTERIYASRRGHDRDLLKKILKVWGQDISAVKLKSGGSLWQSLEDVLKVRHRIVHDATPANDHDVEVALQCAEALRVEVVYRIAGKLGFSVEAGDRWAYVSLKDEHGGTSEVWYVPWDPVEKKVFEP
jgi:hypothetical protein